MKKYKVVVLGEGAVGKTSTLVRYFKNTFNDRQKSTIQVGYFEKTITIDRQSVTLVVYDTAGQERFHSLAPLYYRDAKGIILVYDITDEDSFTKVEKWLTEIKKFCDEQDPRIIIVGNKTDLHTKRRVTKEQAQTLSRKLKCLCTECSAKANSGVDEMFLMLTKELMKVDKSGDSSPSDRLFEKRKTNLQVIDVDIPEDGKEFGGKKKKPCCGVGS